MPGIDTFDAMKEDLRRLVDRNVVSDTDYLAYEPRIFENAELRISRDLDPVGDTQFAIDSLAVGQIFVGRKAGTISSQSFEITDQATGQTYLLPFRPLPWLQKFWPYPNARSRPRYVAVNDEARLRIAPPPDQTYPYRHTFRRHRDYLAMPQQSNLFTDAYPDALFYACAVEASIFAQEDRRQDLRTTYEAMYQARMATIMLSEQRTAMTADELGPAKDRSP